MQVGPTTTFSQISQQQDFRTGLFKSDDAHIRFSAGKGLYTSQKASTAKLTFWDQGKVQARLQDRTNKQAAGATVIKDAIDREYGRGVGELVFTKVSARAHHDLNRGVTRADIAMIAHELQAGSRAQSAIRDPDLGHVAGRGSDLGRTVDFFKNHFEAVSHPEFWKVTEAKFNADNFGAGMAFAVLDRIAGNGQITSKDIRDLNNSLDPLNIPTNDVEQRLAPTLAGPLDNAAKTAIANQLFAVYGRDNALHSINISYDERQALARVMADPQASGGDKLNALKQAYSEAILLNGMAPDNLIKPLSKVPV